MKKTVKKYLFLISVTAIITFGTAGIITAGEKSAQLTKGTEIKQVKLTEENLLDELDKIRDVIFSFLPSRG